MAKDQKEPKIIESENQAQPIVEQPQMVPLADVTKMIDAAIAKMKDEDKPKKLKKVTEHVVHVWRFDGKWVTDFKDRNVDEYSKTKVHAFNKYNEQLREFQAWIELVFNDGTSKEVALTTYLKNRVPIYCTLIKRHLEDKSYAIGEVEKKKEVNDKLIGTGIMIDQEVIIQEETFELKTPDGQILMLPWYVIS